MKITRIYAGSYSIAANDGSTFTATVTENGKEWKLYDAQGEWIDTFDSLKACKDWIGE